MASQRDRYCSFCGQKLVHNQGAGSVKCTGCGSITRLRPHVHFHQVNGHVQQAAANMAAGLLGRVATGINALATNAANAANKQHSHRQSQPRQGQPKLDPREPNHNIRPPAPQQALFPPQVQGRKRAVLCGVSYIGKKYMLKGSVTDVKNMRFFLMNCMGFPNGSVVVLTEEEQDPQRIPTRQNIMMALRWLVHGARAGDSLVFHYSGHGSKKEDEDMDELDGFDETICPVNHETSGKIVDEEINMAIVRPLPRGVRLHAIIDSCYSGTVLDLPFLCRLKRDGFYKWEDHRIPLGTYKGTNGGVAICISACDDHETSADTSAFTGDTVTGAMTFSFIQAMENESSGHPTYGRLLTSMRSAIRAAKEGDGPAGPVQEPQLSSSEMFEIYSAKITL